MKIGVINAVMIGVVSEPSEHVDWSSPDVDTEEGWRDVLGVTVEEYAASNHHMIVFEVEDAVRQ